MSREAESLRKKKMLFIKSMCKITTFSNVQLKRPVTVESLIPKLNFVNSDFQGTRDVLAGLIDLQGLFQVISFSSIPWEYVS